VTGQAAATAARSPLLEPLGGDVYQTYVVRDPQTTITFGGSNATLSTFTNQVLTAQSEVASQSPQVRANWFPRWQATGDGRPGSVTRTPDGSIALATASPASTVALAYTVQPLDWLARALAAAGILLVMIYPLIVSHRLRDGYHVASRKRSVAS
jgi:hypothetical protein